MTNLHKTKEQLVSEIEELRLQNKQLQNARQFSDKLLDTANAIVVTLDSSANITLFNKFAQKVTGYTANEVLSKNWFEIFIPREEKSEIPSVFEKALQQMPEASQHKNLILAKNGTELLINWNNNVLKNEKGEIYGVLSIGTDITQKQMIELALKESEERNRLLLDLAPDSFFHGDENGNLIGVNSKAAEVTGFTKEELLKLNLSDLFTKQSLKNKKLRYDLLQNGQIVTNEREVKKKDGTTIDVEMRSRLMPDGTYQSFFRDISRRKRAEQELKKSEQWFSAITEQSAEGITVATHKGNYVFVNPAFCTMMGYTKDELLKMTVFDVKKIKGEQAKKGFKKSKSNKIGTKIEVELQRKDKSTFMAEVTGKPILIGDKDLVLGIVSDISERKKSEEALAEANSIINRSPAVAFLWKNEKNWPIEFVSENVKNLCGYSAKEFLEQKVYYYEIIHKDDKVRVNEEVVRYSSKKTLQTFVHEPYRIRTKNGSIKWIDDRTYVRRDTEGNITHFEGMVYDITERKEAEETLRKSEEQLRLITENTTDNIGITTFDLKATYLYVNPSVKSVLGYEPEDLLGKSFFEFIHPDDKKTLYPLLKKYVQQKLKNMLSQDVRKISETVEYRFKNNKGEWRHLQSTVNIIGKRLLAVSRDITDRINSEKQLAESEERFRNLFEHSRAVMMLIDTEDGRVVDANAAACHFYGWKKAELTGKHMSEINTLSAEEIKTKMSKAAKHKTNYFVFKHCLADGTVRDVEVYSSPIQINNKKLLYSLIFDITERKIAESALLKSEEKYRTLFEKSADAVLIIRENKFVDCNPATVKMVGYKDKQSFLNLHPSALSPDTQPDGRNSLEKANEMMAIAYKKGSHRFEWMHKKKNGEVFPVEVLLTSIPSDEGVFLHVVWRDISERKTFEKKILESENKLRMIVEGTPNLFFYTQDKTGKLTYISPSVEKLTGRSVEDWLKRKDWFITDNEINDQAKKTTWHHLAGNVTKGSILTEVEHADKRPILLEIYENPVFENGQVVGLQGVAHDVTQRVRAEEALKQSEKNFRLLFENSPLGTYIATPDGDIIDGNQSLLRILGSPSLEATKKINVLQFQPLIENGYAKIFKKAVSTAKVQFLEIAYTSKWAKESYLSSYIIPLVNQEGMVEKVYTVMEDITERRQADLRIRESEERFRLAFHTSPDSITISRLTDGRYIDVNQGFTQVSGFTREEAIGKSAIELSIWMNADERINFIKILEQDGVVYNHEVKLRMKNGYTVFGLLSAVVMQYNHEPVILTIARDISELKRVEEEKNKLETQLRRSQKMETIGTLAGGIAHDFNNILAPIMGFTELAMLKLDENAPIAGDLNQVLKGVHRAKDLVEQILLFSKQSEKERQPIGLQSIVKEALKLLRPSIPTTIEIKQLLDPACPNVRADATQIHQVLVNLSTNAMQAMDEKGGTLCIELKQIVVDRDFAKLHPNLEQGNYARLSVCDTGTGMDESTLERIFEPFFTTKAVDKGTGLGLSVVHGIVRSHKGDIQVQSAPGKGTTFNIYLPTTNASNETEPNKSKKVKGGSESVLIVDDEADIGEMVQIMLDNFGYKSEVFSDPSKALDAFKQNPKKFDLLISDLTMPQMTGLDLAEELHETRPEFPVIIMTGYGDSLTRPTQKRYSIKHILSKPVAVKELAKAVRTVLDAINPK